MNDYMGPEEVALLHAYMRFERKRSGINSRCGWVGDLRRLIHRPPGVKVENWDWIRRAFNRVRRTWELFSHEQPEQQIVRIAGREVQGETGRVLLRGRMGESRLGGERD